MTTAALGLLAGLLMMSYVSAVVPLGPSEAYVLALTVSGTASPVWGLAVASTAALGQVAGKLTVFLSVRGTLRRPPRWLARVVPDRLVARLVQRSQAHPCQLAILVGVSALVSMPPLALVAPAAGTTTMRPPVFAAIGFAGRLARFSVLALVPALLW